MKNYIEKRVYMLAHHIIETGSTVRACAESFGISKSTVHKDMVERLAKENPALFERVDEVLQKNKAERHIRGGVATKEKYLREVKKDAAYQCKNDRRKKR